MKLNSFCQVANGKRHVIHPSHASLTRVKTTTFRLFKIPPSVSPTLSTLSQSAMDPDDELQQSGRLISKPSDLFNKIVFLQADLIYHAIAFLIAPISTLLSLISESFRRAEEAKSTVEYAVRKSPSAVAHRVRLAVRRLSYGLVAAAFMCMVMILLLATAASVSAVAIRFWIEEPVARRGNLNFDYTVARPRALYGVDYRGGMKTKKTKNLGIPVGHTFSVSVILLMPESQFNRAVGVFQLSAELISTNGNIIAGSSQPCMLRFRSTPVRFTRTFLSSLPLLLGLSTESQKLTFPVLKYKEQSYQRSGAIQVTITPRVGTSALPELYEAHILINSKLPWTKELVHRWRWTCFLWSSFYLYLTFLAIFVYFWRPIVFRAVTLARFDFNREASISKEVEKSFDEMAEVTVELLRKWQEMRRKRKAALFGYDEDVGSTSASSISCSREYIGSIFEEDVGDSESMVLEGWEE
ncbi:seipin-1 [Cucurbita moschata]|uniref:Seipin-1 n=1 Tax=Cucurbita moschata TaxID=3662 RepID=A0A6J1F5S3_CUCMO|nr:seipin-1 [Cucurbita moschata]